MKAFLILSEWALPVGLSFGGEEYKWAVSIGPLHIAKLKSK
jgi:hypothetical protein